MPLHPYTYIVSVPTPDVDMDLFATPVWVTYELLLSMRGDVFTQLSLMEYDIQRDRWLVIDKRVHVRFIGTHAHVQRERDRHEIHRLNG